MSLLDRVREGTVPRTLALLTVTVATLPLDLALVGGAVVARRVRRRVVSSSLGPGGPHGSTNGGSGRLSPAARAGGEHRWSSPRSAGDEDVETTGTRPRRRTVLLTGGKMTKALALARAFHAAGHRVVLADSARYRLTGHRFSRAIDAFHVLPVATDPAFGPAVLDLVTREGVDVFVPVSSPASSVPEAEVGELLTNAGVDVVHGDAKTTRRLDDKDEFARMAAELGLRVPETVRVTDAQEIVDFPWAPGRTYVAKSIAYDPVRRLDLTRLPRPSRAETARFAESLPVSRDNPWIVQEYVDGQEYCTHATARDGRITVHACCRSSASQLNYEMVEHPGIEHWVETFIAGHHLTGQISMDLIERDGPHGPEVVGLECNPRTHSAITMFYDHPDLAAAYLDDWSQTGQTRIVPTPGSRPTYWLWHEAWRILRHPTTARAGLRVIATGTDAVLSGADPVPYLALHHLALPALLLDNLRRLRGWTKVDLNIGKLVEVGGD